MTDLRVNSDFLNLRDAPKTGTILAELPRATKVTVVSPGTVAGWPEVKVGSGPTAVTGFISAKYLRTPVSDDKEALILAASTEWMRFDKGKGEEHKDPYYKYIGDMWDKVGSPSLDGKNRDQPWSAAFISWCVLNAKSYAGFNYNASHSAYVVDSIVKKKAGTSSPFWGWRITEKKPALGDLVCQWRKTKTTYDTAVKKGSYFSHCDIVAEIGDGFIKAIGGNVNNVIIDKVNPRGETVGYKRYSLETNGFLKPEKNLYAILKNNL